MTSPAPARFDRVVLMATCYADAEAAAGPAIWLARRLDTGLLGVLVEDENILSYAAFSSARFFTESGDEVIAVSAERMRAAFGSDTAAFRDLFEGAEQSGVPRWRAEVRRGRLPAVLRATAQKGDLVVLGFRKLKTHTGGIVAVLRDVADLALAGLAARRAAEMSRPLTVLVDATQAELAEAVAEDAAFARAAVLHFSDLAGLRAILSPMASEILFLHARGDLKDALGAVVEAARCPVVAAL